MSQVISLRLPDDTARRLRQSARLAGRSLSEWGALSVDEWLRQNEFADIEFRSIGGERQACLKNALPIWQLIQVARFYHLDAAETAAHFGWPVSRIQAALNYYAEYPAEIDQAIAASEAQTPETLRRLLPQIEVLTVDTREPALMLPFASAP